MDRLDAKTPGIIAFRMDLLRLDGVDTMAALMLSQAIHRQKRVGPGEWWTCGRSRWQRECGLGRRVQERCRRDLRQIGVLEERQGDNNRVLYRVKLDAIADLLPESVHHSPRDASAQHQGRHGPTPAPEGPRDVRDLGMGREGPSTRDVRDLRKEEDFSKRGETARERADLTVADAPLGPDGQEDTRTPQRAAGVTAGGNAQGCAGGRGELAGSGEGEGPRRVRGPHPITGPRDVYDVEWACRVADEVL